MDRIRYDYGYYHIRIYFRNADTDRKIIYTNPQKTNTDTEWIKRDRMRIIKVDIKMDMTICTLLN